MTAASKTPLGANPEPAPPATPVTVADRAREIGEALAARGFGESRRFTSWLWARPAPRPCQIVLSRQSRTKYAGEIRYRKHLGFRVRIDLDCEVYTRIYFVRAGMAKSGILRRIWRWRGLQLIENVPAVIDDHVVLAREADWAGALLLDHEAVEAVAELLRRYAGRLSGSVYLEPGTLAYGSPLLSGARVEADYVENMLDALETISAACERLPQPSRPMKPSKLRAFAREHPLAAAVTMIGGLLGCLLVVTLIGSALLLGLAALLGAT